jgi:hypothetical protein
LGLSFFGFSSNYRADLLNEFYVMSRHMTISYLDFNNMPTYVRRFLLDKLVDEFTKKE